MDRDTSSLRTFAAAGGIAMIFFGGWHSWKVFQEGRLAQSRTERRLLAERWADSLDFSSDSLCARDGSDALVHSDPLGWLPGGLGHRLRARDRHDGWDFACMQLPDSGMIFFAAIDSGCGRYSGNGLWSHSCGVVHQVWDLEADVGSSRVSTSHARSRWVHPGLARICPSESRPEAPPESLIVRLCSGDRPNP